MLDRLALSPDDRAKVDAKLAARILRPTEAERALWQREKAILMATFGRSGGFAHVEGGSGFMRPVSRRIAQCLRPAGVASIIGIVNGATYHLSLDHTATFTVTSDLRLSYRRRARVVLPG